MTITYTNVSFTESFRAFYDTITPFDLQGQHGYKVVVTENDGTWCNTMYTTLFDGHSVGLVLEKDPYREELDAWEVTFRVDGDMNFPLERLPKVAIVRWLLKVWASLLEEYPERNFVCSAYTYDGQGSTRDQWYAKLGFEPIPGQKFAKVLKRN